MMRFLRGFALSYVVANLSLLPGDLFSIRATKPNRYALTIPIELSHIREAQRPETRPH